MFTYEVFAKVFAVTFITVVFMIGIMQIAGGILCVCKGSYNCKRFIVVEIDDSIIDVEFTLGDCFRKCKGEIGGSMVILCTAKNANIQKVAKMFAIRRGIPICSNVGDVVTFLN